MASKTYCVENLTIDGGYTTNVDMIIVNLNRSKEGLKEEFFEELLTTKYNSVIHFYAAGKYVVFLELTKGFNNCLMEFTDFEGGSDIKKKAKISSKYIDKFRDNNHLELWEKFTEMEMSYTANKNAVELIEC